MKNNCSLSISRFVLHLAVLTSLLFPLFQIHFAAAQQSANQQLVIIDTDVGDDIDDVLALGLAVASPEVKILAINSAWGDTELRTRLLDRLLHEVGREDIPVGLGITTHRNDTAAFSQARWAEREPLRPHPAAVDLLLNAIKEHPNQVTLIAIAPLTNLAATIDRDPATFKKLKRIVMMGGSIHKGYDDLGYAPDRGASAEYNIAMDIPAAQKVFASGVPINMMPLDSTQLKLDELKREILFTHSSNLTDALALLYLQWSQSTKQQTPTVFDAMAVAYVVKPELCPTTPMHIRVDEKGYTREERGTPNANVCLHSDSDQFFEFYLPRVMSY
jgi:purine nucleosidase